MFFSKTQNSVPVNNKNTGDKADFTAALAYFALTHTELYSCLAVLKVKEISQQASEFTSISQNVAAMSEEISASVQQINASIQEVASTAEKGASKINELVELGESTGAVLSSMIENTEKLGEQVKNIDEISKNVSDIADQTNLLALNAAIEAARAGDAGRGFNVVAEEVRKLAAQTKQAVGNVKQISENMNMQSAQTVQNVHNVQGTFQHYLDSSNTVNELFRQSDAYIGECAGMVESIANATEEYNATAEQLSAMAEELSRTTEFISNLLERESGYLTQILGPRLGISGSGTTANILAARLIDHADFLKKAISEAGRGARVAGHHECAFGKWYDEHRQQYGHIQAFKDMDEPHQKVHEYGQKLAREFSSQNLENLMHASTGILKAFIKLYDALVNNR